MDRAFLKGPQTVTIESKKGGMLALRVTPALAGPEAALAAGVLTFELAREDYGMFELFHVQVPGYRAPEMAPLGKLLFDRDGNWIYDGTALSVGEQEKLAGHITGHRCEMERLLKDII